MSITQRSARFLVIAGLMLMWTAAAQAQNGDMISYTFTAEAVISDGLLSAGEDTAWKLLDHKDAEYEGGVVIITSRGSRSGIAYFNGMQVPVTLLSGEPGLSEGFRTALLFADSEHRRLTLTDGTVRRVIDPEADLGFPTRQLVELIITRDRRYAIDLSRGLRFAVSPPLPN
jgi:hypothetical protein